MKTHTHKLPLKFYICIQLISNLLQALGKLLVVWITQLSSTELLPGHYSATTPMSLNPLIDETAQADKERVRRANDFT